MGFSITESLFGPPDKDSFPGDFFVDSYGILSFIIPAYLLGAALILIDKSYKPSRIFILYCVIFPFMTLAIGFSFLRDYDYFAGQIVFFSLISRQFFSFIVICLTVLEGAVIYGLSSSLFPDPPSRRFRASNTPPRPVNHPAASLKPEIKLLCAPINAVREGAREAYTSAFEELQNMENSNIETIDDVIENFAPNLEAINSKLQTLTLYDDMEDIDAKLNKLDNDLNTLKFELSAIDDEAEGIKHGFGAGNEENIDDYAVNEADMDGFDELNTYDGSYDFEKIISEVEAEAALKTGEAIKKKETGSLKQDKARKIKGHYSVPVEGILKEYSDDKYWVIDGATYEAAAILKETLNEFKIQAEVTGIRKGPVITMFEILPSPGVKLSKIVNLQDNIALRLAASSVRIVAPIPGKHAVGIEIPNKKRNIVSFREIIEAELARGGKRPEIPVVLGKDITGESVTVDLAAMPHLLIAGATGAGKSVCVNTMILSILYQCKPSQCRLILIDPKIVELKLYNDIPHLLTPVITEPKRAFQALQYCIYEMERRYACLDSMGVRDIKTYNRRIKEKKIAAEHIPYIVVVIDEFADLMATTGKELESTVARLAAMSRAVGIHLVLATQRPSIDVITGLIKSNIPSRIAFMVASMMDSRIIIDTPGAEKLLGKGDMLYSGIVDPFPVRMQGAFVSEEEVEAVVNHVKTLGEPDYIDEEIFFDDDEDAEQNIYTEGDDPLYDKALEIVMQQGKASASYIQRRLKIGYNRAARLVEEMEHRGVVGPAQGSRPRELLRAV
ncbi:MAG: DNA translocase FtsK [Spirochaetaceae bacterium]|nr:DNA translocase FtsK [Spirochaetaceae bacterium]